MPFNGSGTFSRLYSWVTDRNEGRKIVADRHDAEDDGFATGLSNCICRDGQSTTTARIPFAAGIGVHDGSQTAPSITFTNDTDNGFYRIGADNVGLSVGGGKIIDFSALVTVLSQRLTVSADSLFAFSVGQNGTTNPALNVVTSTASSATGVQVTSAAAGGRVALAVISSGTNEGLNVDAKGSGTVRLGATSTGDIEFSRSLVPTSNDGAALGSSSLMFSDLFLASGGVINFNNGDVTVTHSANTVTFAGASSGYNFDAPIVITSSSDSAFVVGATGATNAAFIIDTNAVGATVGLKVTAGTHSNGVILEPVSSYADEEITYSAKGSSPLYLQQPLTTGPIICRSNLRPSGNGTSSLGESSTGWGDLHLYTGSAIRWTSNDVTITHSANSLAFAGAASGYTFDSLLTLTSANASAFAVGRQGATDPAFSVNASAATSATGIKVTAAAAAGGAALSVTSSGTNESLLVDAKGSGTIRFGATSTGTIEFSRNAVPTSSDGAALGTSSLMWSDLFLASGSVINFNNGDVTVTHSANTIAFAGASSGYSFDAGVSVGGVLTVSGGSILCNPAGTLTTISNNTTDGSDNKSIHIASGATLSASRGAYLSFYGNEAASTPGEIWFVTGDSGTRGVIVHGNVRPGTAGFTLGTTTAKWEDLFLASGAVINFDSDDVTVTHSANALAFAGASSGYSFDGVVTVAGGTAAPAGGSTAARLLMGTTAGFGIYYGSGVPTVSAAQGSVYLRSDGSSTSTRMYVNTDGATTWTNLVAAA